jgi:pimeloyl-ACP methyl ester carboxylesterase
MVINADFPFQSKFLNIDGSKIHYVEEGDGDHSVLFLHGNPTSSYIWRNIIPIVARAGKNNRCIALDLIGFGKSDKPDIDYNFQDHYKYVKGFIDKLQLSNKKNRPIIVGHDWGGVLGFWHAFNHQENIKGIAFMETFPFTISIDDFPPEFAKLLHAFRTQGSGYELIQVQNVFVEQVIPSAVFNKQNMSEAIMKHYREPFPTIQSRKPIRRFPEMLPLDPKVESEAYTVIQKLEAALSEFKFPTLLIKGNPGAVIPESRAKWLEERIPNLVIKDIGPGIHYLQEDNPEGIANSILEWSNKIT